MAFCNVDSPTKFIDIAVPCNNKSPQSLGLMWWMLAREVLRLRGSISRDMPWEVMPDLFFYRDPEEVEKEDRERLVALVFIEHISWEPRSSVFLSLEPMCNIILSHCISRP